MFFFVNKFVLFYHKSHELVPFKTRMFLVTANANPNHDVTPHPLCAANSERTSTNLSHCMNIELGRSHVSKWTLDSVSLENKNPFLANAAMSDDIAIVSAARTPIGEFLDDDIQFCPMINSIYSKCQMN